MKLCFVHGNIAYFTPRPLSEQSGDDWDDAPYEHNAEPPYEDDILKVAFDGEWERPCDGCTNSRYSVDQINASAVPWLGTSPYSEHPNIYILGGVTLDQFCDLIEKGGGTVYFPRSWLEKGKV